MATSYKFGGTRGQFVKSINERIAEAKARGDTEEVARLNRAAGVESALLGASPVGLADLGVTGYNWATGSNVPTATEALMRGLGSPTQATEDQYSVEYNTPSWLLLAYSAGSLTKSGFKALRAWRESSKIKQFTKTLPEAEKTVFDKWMLTGQGSDDPVVAEIIQRLQKNPKYAEFFHQLDKQATETAIKEVSSGPLSKDMARRGLITGLQDKIDGLKEARATAGDRMFSRAFNYTGTEPIVAMDKTLSEIRTLKDNFSKVDTPAAQQALKFLDGLENQITSAGGTVTQQVMKAGPLGVPVQSTVQAPSGKFTAQQLQGWLSEFGKKAANGDSLVNGLTSTDEKRISAAIFGALKDDLKAGAQAAPTKEARAGLRFLDQARNEVRIASEKYNDFVAQGMPAYFKGKTLAELSYEDVVKAYQTSTPEQRVVFREALKNTQPEALQYLDSNITKDFYQLGFTPRKANGLPGIDLGKLSTEWAKMTEGEKQLYTSALGVKPDELEKRMKDALLFTRKMQIGAATPTPTLLDKVSNDLGRVAGAAGSYSLKQGVDIATDSLRKLSKGLSDDQIMKALLNKDAAQALRDARMTPNAIETLTNLEKVNKYPLAVPVNVMSSTAASVMQVPSEQPAQPEQPTQTLEMPPEFSAPPTQTSGLADLEMPPGM